METPPRQPLRPRRMLVAHTAKKKRVVKLNARELARLRCHNLELDVMNLRQEIATLETTRQLLFARTFNRADDHALGSFVKMIREFYALTRDGYTHANMDGDLDAPTNLHRFLVTAFDPTMAVGDGSRTKRGLELFMEDLSFKMKLGGGVTVRLLRTIVRKDDAAPQITTVTANTRITCALTPLLLDMTFPHVRQFPRLREKLIGRSISVCGESDFEFDVSTGRIVRYVNRLDTITPILAVVDAAEYKLLLGSRRSDDIGDGEVWCTETDAES